MLALATVAKMGSLVVIDVDLAAEHHGGNTEPLPCISRQPRAKDFGTEPETG